MDDPRWLRLITIGLVLAALAVGYFLFSGGMSVNKSSKAPSPPSPGGSSSLRPPPQATQSEAQTLPGTGFPAALAIVFSVSAMISGFSLRKFPN